MILVLGGTAEARDLAAALAGAGVPVVSSLAGRVSNPRLPAGEVRIGGFGGPPALAAWLREHGVAVVAASAFGGKDGFRISFAADEAVLEEAMRRIAAALE